MASISASTAHVVRRSQDSRRRQTLHAVDAEIDAIGLQLQRLVETLHERRLAREGRAQLFTRQNGHRQEFRCERGSLIRDVRFARMPEPKLVSASKTTMSQTMLPSDANPYGNVHGGEIMKLIDACAGAAATRHARARVVTARIDELSFLAPVYVGHLVTASASVNHVGKSSMEVGVRVDSEDLLTGKAAHVASAYLVFVAIDEHGRPVSLPPLLAETNDERRRMKAAEQRCALRLKRPRTS